LFPVEVVGEVAQGAGVGEIGVFCGSWVSI
jgi:hypothetical protein